MKNGSQTHLPVFKSQFAPTPQITASHLCLQRPLIHACGFEHDLVAEH